MAVFLFRRFSARDHFLLRSNKDRRVRVSGAYYCQQRKFYLSFPSPGWCNPTTDTRIFSPLTAVLGPSYLGSLGFVCRLPGAPATYISGKYPVRPSRFAVGVDGPEGLDCLFISSEHELREGLLLERDPVSRPAGGAPRARPGQAQLGALWVGASTSPPTLPVGVRIDDLRNVQAKL